MKSNPAISIVIPVYNVAQYLPECLDSVLMQTIGNFEILCVNDASLDKSYDILKQYEKKYSCITLLNHTTNCGLPVARNTGIEAARGDYIFFIDADDIFFSKDSLFLLYSIAERDAADEVIGGTLRWDEETGERHFGYHKAYLKENCNGVSFEAAPFLVGNVTAWNKLIRTDFLKSNTIRFNPDLRKFEDNPFSWKVHLLSKSISICTAVTYLHRLRSKSAPKSIMQVTKEDYLYHSKAAIDMQIFFDQNRVYSKVRYLFEKYFIQWCQRDFQEVNKWEFTEERKQEIFEIYRSLLHRIPKSSIRHFSNIQKTLLLLIQDKQYKIAWQEIVELKEITNEGKKSKQLQTQLQAVYNSTSWRMTAPFRFVAELVKKSANVLG